MGAHLVGQFQLAFTSNYEIYKIKVDGSGLTNFSNHPAADYHPAWSPDGTKIAFSSQRDGNMEIYVMNADGTGLTKLTKDHVDDRYPDW